MKNKVKSQKSKIKSYNLKFKIIKFLLVFLTFNFSLLIFNLSDVVAINMDSSRYRIQFGNVNITSGNKSSANYNLSDTVGQTAAGQFQSTGYIIKAGFQYIHSIIPFTFSISNIHINFGSVIANNPVTQTTTLTVSFGGAGQYQVTAIEEGPMKTFDGGNYIPDTSCNGGSDTCTEYLAKPWTSTSAYGFGYNMSGQDIPSDFVNSTYFRPFPDRTQNESPAVVMTNPNVGKNRQATVTFKLNVSPIQPAGSYQTVINFVATPSF